MDGTVNLQEVQGGLLGTRGSASRNTHDERRIYQLGVPPVYV
jgi:hypothetical protein